MQIEVSRIKAGSGQRTGIENISRVEMNDEKKINIVLAGQGNSGKSSVFQLSDRTSPAYRQLGRKDN
ncbi:MAG: hypothetical protein MZV64_28710 [Ignavibacteriales bacterium]|nr:hypothetical protein [Ignavibacteriales bacterium]